MLILGFVVPATVIAVHLARVDNAAGQGSPGISNRQEHLWTGATGLPPLPTTDPTELITESPTPAVPTSAAETTTPPPRSPSTSQPPAAAAQPPPAANAPAPPSTPPPLLVDNFDGSPAWSDGRGRNDLGLITECEVFRSCSLSGGALVLRYDDDGWFGSYVSRSVSEYTYLVLRLRGLNGGEESDIRLTLGGVESMLASLTLAGGGRPSITTSYKDLRIPMAANGISTANPDELQLDFWHGGASTVYIDEIRFE